MKFKLILVASDDDGLAHCTEVDMFISESAMLGVATTNKGAIVAILEKLSQVPGFSIT